MKFIKKVTGKRKDNGEYVEGSLMYDFDQDCWRIIEYFFDIEEPKLDSQFGVCAYEVYLDTVEQLPCDCWVMLKETTIQVYCPKYFKT